MKSTIEQKYSAANRIIAAIDVDSEEKALAIAGRLSGCVGVLKAGLELTLSAGMQVLDTLREAGNANIFYDAKLHDIPNTVAGAVRAAVRRKVWSITLHTSGGEAMLRAAREAAEEESSRLGVPRPLLFGVTVLTSITPEALRYELQVPTPLKAHVAHLAQTAKRCGCDGVIASAFEIDILRKVLPDPDFLIITPGVRPAGAPVQDQARVKTPAEALQLGASYLVIGRPIVGATDPAAAALAIAEEMEPYCVK